MMILSSIEDIIFYNHLAVSANNLLPELGKVMWYGTVAMVVASIAPPSIFSSLTLTNASRSSS